MSGASGSGSSGSGSSGRLGAVAGIVATVVVGGLVAFALSDGADEVEGVPVPMIAAAVAFAINWMVFIPSAAARTEQFYDLTGSLTYLSTTAVVLLASDGLDARSIVVAALVAVWAARLGTFLFVRVRASGKDGRFDQIKVDPVRFLLAWTLQGLWVLFTLAAVIAIISGGERRSFGIFAIVGLGVWAAGFAIEVVADRQKSAFKADPANDGRFVTSGLWAWSRHPNYFGEITLWTGIAIMALPVLEGWRWIALVSPVFVAVLLTRISGVPMLERRGMKRWGDDPDYRRYLESTPVLIPRPPSGRT